MIRPRLVFLHITVALGAVAAALQRAETVNLIISMSSPAKCGFVRPIWRSTGFCPPEPSNESLAYYSSSGMQQNLRLIGALPHKSIRQVRVHWLLDLVTVRDWSEDRGISYDFSSLDSVVQMFHENGLRLGFELMGNPSNRFTNFENTTQVLAWYYLVKQVAERYVRKYGITYVKDWNFETWNEPGPVYFRGLNVTIKGFLNYYDACLHGLKDVSPSLKLGGPAMKCDFSERSGFCLAFFNRVSRRSRVFDNGPYKKPEFISFHFKGGEGNYGNATYMLQSEAAAALYLRENFMSLGDVPLYNDEADPVTGWNKSLTFAATAEYAAFISRVIVEHLSTCSSSLDAYELISNDNAFLSYFPYQFTQRTLLARLQINNTRPAYTYMVKKPVYGLMGLLALLGSRRLTVDGKPGALVNLSVLATGSMSKLSCETRVAVVLQNSYPYSTAAGTCSACELRIQLRLDSFQEPLGKLGQCLYAVYQIDDRHGNPYRAWKGMGRPSFPRHEELQALRDSEAPVRSIGPVALKLNNESMQPILVNLPQPGVSLVHVCCRNGSKQRLGSPEDIVFEKVSQTIVLLTWKDSAVYSKCLLRYEIETSHDGHTFVRINQQDSTFPSYYYFNREGTAGFYRVRAVSYWHEESDYSKVAYNANGDPN